MSKGVREAPSVAIERQCSGTAEEQGACQQSGSHCWRRSARKIEARLEVRATSFRLAGFTVRNEVQCNRRIRGRFRNSKWMLEGRSEVSASSTAKRRHLVHICLRSATCEVCHPLFFSIALQVAPPQTISKLLDLLQAVYVHSGAFV